jgi:hypothetical protein
VGELSKEDEESLKRLRADADKVKLPEHPPNRRSRRAKKFADFPIGLDDTGRPFEPKSNDNKS